MTEKHSARDRYRSVVARRLSAARMPLAVLAAALLLACALGGLGWSYAVAIFLAVLAAFALTARRRSVPATSAATNDEGRPALEGLSAANLAAAVPDPMIVFDDDGATIHANDAAVAAFGSFVVGLPLQRKFRAPEMQDLIDALLSGRAEDAVADHVERVPIEHVYKVIGTRIRGSSLFAVVFRDQSEARRIDRMRADFIANASHELRTPLASITGFVETLRGPARDDAKAREHFLKIMHEQTGRMARLIDDLLSLSRLEMKPLLGTGTAVDLRAVVESVVDSLAPLAHDAGVEIQREFPTDEVTVAGSRDELFQVFENLLENACKYGQSGGRVIVAIGMPKPGSADGPSVSFRDFGPGIAAEHIPRITERFYRVDAEASRAHKGTGLGLAIVKHILTRHGGRLVIRSDIGHGAEFTAVFPPRAKSSRAARGLASAG